MLAAAAAAVSFTAQYRMAESARHLAAIAVLEAAIPDAAALVFACLDTTLAADAATPLAILGGLILWLLRLTLAPASTLAGFRAWVLQECPVAPGRRAPTAPADPRTAPEEGDQDRPVPRSGHRTAWATRLRFPCTASPGSAPTWHPSST